MNSCQLYKKTIPCTPWVTVFLCIASVFLLYHPQIQAQQLVPEPEMIFVAGGSFIMGCTFEQGSDCNTDEKPSHEVQLSGFAIAKYEISQALWKQVMGNNPSRFKGDSLPVENVTWDEVQVFIQRLNAQTGKQFRLPTEAEWEYAARGGQHSKQTEFAGSTDLEKVAWCSSNSDNLTHNIGSKQPNELGIYDMNGNVWEWCNDIYGAYTEYAQSNPTGSRKGTARVLRGGCYASIAKQCRTTTRKSFYQGGKDNMTGFRLAMDDDREAKAKVESERLEQERIKAEKKAEQERAEAEKNAKEAEKQAEKRRQEAEQKAKQDAHQRQVQLRRDSIKALPTYTFLTLNAACSGIPQLSYGFKVGQVKIVGWYFSAMSNFAFRGAFHTFPMNSNYYELTGNQKGTKLSASAGLVIMPCKPLSIHIGTGFSYRSLNIETTEGWFSYPKRSFYGVDAALGLMFNIKGFALSAEAVYTPYDFNNSDINWKGCLEGKIGVGFILPNKKK